MFKTLVVNNPKTINGNKKPNEYINTNKFPIKTELAVLAIISVEERAGPTQGVQANENKKPIKKAVLLVILFGSKLIFIFFSLLRNSNFIIPS